MKRILVPLICLGITFSTNACASSNQAVETKSSAAAETTSSDSESATTTEAVTASSEAEKSPETTNGEMLVSGTTMTIGDTCEITLDYATITDDVMPPKPASFYTHYAADSGKKYVDVCIAYKNIASSAITADETMNGKLVYANKYEYSGFTVIEEKNRGSFTYSNITNIAPLTTEYIHYLFEVPEEIANSGKEVDTYLTIANKDFKVEVVHGNDAALETSARVESTHVSGMIKDGETITTNNAEFFVDYSNITNDVLPKNPDSFYQHYEAEAGKAYVDFCIAYKNTSEKSIIADEALSASLKYAGKYDYTGFSMIEEKNRGSFTYSNITSIDPLSTEYVHYLFEVPEEVKNGTESLVISFTVDGKDFEYAVR